MATATQPTPPTHTHTCTTMPTTTPAIATMAPIAHKSSRTSCERVRACAQNAERQTSEREE
eukprot:8113591-Alexandrium_andersonii.AAC.1